MKTKCGKNLVGKQESKFKVLHFFTLSVLVIFFVLAHRIIVQLHFSNKVLHGEKNALASGIGMSYDTEN